MKKLIFIFISLAILSCRPKENRVHSKVIYSGQDCTVINIHIDTINFIFTRSIEGIRIESDQVLINP